MAGIRGGQDAEDGIAGARNEPGRGFGPGTGQQAGAGLQAVKPGGFAFPAQGGDMFGPGGEGSEFQIEVIRRIQGTGVGKVFIFVRDAVPVGIRDSIGRSEGSKPGQLPFVSDAVVIAVGDGQAAGLQGTRAEIDPSQIGGPGIALEQAGQEVKAGAVRIIGGGPAEMDPASIGGPGVGQEELRKE